MLHTRNSNEERQREDAESDDRSSCSRAEIQVEKRHAAWVILARFNILTKNLIQQSHKL